VAYINHDIGDAIRAGILTENDLPLEAAKVLGNRHSVRINTMVSDIVENSWDARTCAIIKGKKPAIKMSEPVSAAAEIMRDFLFKRVYNPNTAQPDAEKAKAAIIFLWGYYNRHEKELPEEYKLHADSLERGVADYIASMTDQYALRLAEDLGK
jgi:dGTPase